MANFAEWINREDAGSRSASREAPVADTVTVYNRDFVYYASGRVTSATIAGAVIAGMVLGGNTRLVGRSQRTNQATPLSVTGNTAGTNKVLVVIEPMAVYLLKASGTVTEALKGQNFNLQGAAGSQLINITPSASGSFELIKPAGGMRGTDNTFGLFRIRKDMV
jgi:hypothetical protein